MTLVGSHDTASAVVGVPADRDALRLHRLRAPGRWSASSSTEPILTEASRAANFTNEGGVDGRIRYLRNVMGLWLLQESLRTWELDGTPGELPTLLIAAAALPAGGPIVDPDDAGFLPPGDMPARIAERAARPSSRPRRRARRSSAASSTASRSPTRGRCARPPAIRAAVEVVHLVGGGARNACSAS